MVTELLIRLAGADPDRFDGIEHEQGRYAALGAAMLVPPLIGGVAIHATARYLQNGVALAITFALTWAIVILTVDRVLVVTTLRRVPGDPFRFANVLAILFRVLLATLVGFAIGFFGKLAISAKSANQEIIDEMRRNAAVAVRPLREDLDRVNLAITGYTERSDQELANARDRLSQAVAARTLEAQGVGGSRRYGDQGPGYRAAEAEVRERQAAVAALEKSRARQLAALTAERNTIQANIDRVSNQIAQGEATDVLAQVRALERVLARQPYLWWFTAFFAACLLLLELVPVVAKAIIVRDSAYALRERMKTWTEEERLRIELEAIRQAHARRVELRVEFIEEEAEWEAYDVRSKLASRQSRARQGPGFTFRPTSPENPTSRGA